MISIREKYFELSKISSKYLNQNIINSLLMLVNGFDDQTALTLHFDDECKNITKLDNYIKDILNGKPYQYVINTSWFMGLPFFVDEDVLIPRNETEELVLKVIDKIKEIYNRQNLKIADVCTGSGCIAISLKKAFLESDIFATDISKKAILVAEKNAKKFNADITLLEGDMCEPLIKKNIEFDVIVSNPPYIPTIDTVDSQTLQYEPHLALFASPSTKFYEEIFKASKKILKRNGLMAFEIGEDMVMSLTQLIKQYFPLSKYEFLKDFYGKYRFLFILYKGEGKEEN